MTPTPDALSLQVSAVLPDQFVVPALPYVVGLLLGVLVVGVWLYSLSPPMTRREVLALAPWMVVGGALHVLYGLGAFPSSIAPLFSSPSVYLTTFVLGGLVWGVGVTASMATGDPAGIPRHLGSVGLGVVIVLVAAVVWQGVGLGTLAPIWPTFAVLLALVVTAPAVLFISLFRTDALARTGAAGVLVVFAHALDGISTAVGVDVLGTGERSLLPRLVMDVAAALPTAEAVGVGWLFVLVKLVVAVVVVVLLADYVDEAPAQGNLLLALVAAVGLGPGAHNLLLFAVGG